MKILKQRLQILIGLILVILTMALFLIIRAAGSVNISINAVFVLLLLSATILVLLFILEHKKYNIAKLIKENEIFSIEAVKKRDNSKDSIEFIISCFGILLGQKVIMFNTDGIGLKDVKITKDTIIIEYGKGNQTELISLLYKPMEEKKLKEVIQKFQYETGITPNIVNL